MPRGGAREGAGRPPGSINKRSQELQDKVAASGKTPVEFLTDIYQDDKEDKRLRVEAAKAAAPFVHAKIAVVEQHDANPLDELSPEEQLEQLEALVKANPEIRKRLLSIEVAAQS